MNTLARLVKCAGFSEPSLFATAITIGVPKFSCAGPDPIVILLYCGPLPSIYF